MPMREQILEYNSEYINLQRTGISNKSHVASVTIAKDDLAPAPPTSVAASQVDGGIRLDWTNSTLNADESTCVDMRWVSIYYKSTTGVTQSNYDGKYTIGGSAGDVQVYVDRIAAATERFYVVTAIDSTGNESTDSTEVTETAGNIGPTTVIPDDASGLIFDDTYGADGVVTGDTMLGIIFLNPASTWVEFDRYRLWFQYTDDNGVTWYDGDGVPAQWTEIPHVARTGYVHKALTAAYGYRYKATIVGRDGTESSTADTAGGNTTNPNASDNNAVIATLVLAENITATNEVRGTHISAATSISINDRAFGNDGIQLDYNSGNPRFYVGDGANVFVKFDGTDLTWKAANTELDASGNLTATSVDLTGGLVAGAGSDIDAGYLTAGTILSQSIVLGIDAGQGDVEIRSGIATGDFDNAGSNSGFILGVDDSDSDTAKFFFGDGSDYVKWDGSTLTVRGDLGATTVSFTDLLPGTNTASLIIGGAGYIKSSNYSAGSDGFIIEGDGSAEFNDVTVRGKLIAGADSSMIVDYLAAGTITSKSINMTVAAGTGDVEIRSGIATGDFANSGAATGFILGIDDSDADKAKFYFGSSTKYIEWDGTDLDINGGAVTASTFRTASSGSRLVVAPSVGAYSHALVIYDSGNDERTRLDESYLELRNTSGVLCAYLEGIADAQLYLGYSGADRVRLYAGDSGNPPYLHFLNVRGEIDYCELQNTTLKELTGAPATVDGKIVYADGSTWNPGSGEGAYIYYNSAWNYLG